MLDFAATESTCILVRPAYELMDSLFLFLYFLDLFLKSGSVIGDILDRSAKSVESCQCLINSRRNVCKGLLRRCKMFL